MRLYALKASSILLDSPKIACPTVKGVSLYGHDDGLSDSMNLLKHRWSCEGGSEGGSCWARWRDGSRLVVWHSATLEEVS